MEKANTLVLFPLGQMGHLVPMIELAKRLHHHGLTVHVLLLELPFINNDPINSYISNVKASHPTISFHQLPTITLPFHSPNPFANLIETLNLSKPYLFRYLHLSSSFIRALILDVFSGPITCNIVEELRFPIYIFCPISASTLSALLYIPTLLSQTNTNFNECVDAPLHFPGLSYPISASYIPSFLLDRPITGSGLNGEPRHESLVWLDEQPSEPRGSVVLLSFGSLGTFSKSQLKEIAIGLECSRQRFLWIVRGPPQILRKTLMPDRCEERTRERGILVRSWAPQVELLEHEAVGGFVTHCGWNSVLEALVAGVAMIAWPLYAEQKMNKLFIVEEGELAINMQGDENGFVVAKEVEKRVRWLMDTQGGES
ncbi:anthocyanidin 5,3-O-glucosyltransferase-like [Phalaenopsis equestris]|uniref:anthocyanidin 5,3-O-glucosyltransferase-like n=1 Tax=Phalaenopsis equestris TaxID=78828 RepID=UPI0009E464F9|nr:anthocyanidin 5,3-O-glucosyltransferase-like [Phalaenopsis equestris]